MAYTPAGFHDTVLDITALRERMQQMCILVACARDEIIGTVAGAVAASGEGHLRGMAVSPVYQGAGIAVRLLETIEDWLKDQGCTRVTLDTTHPLLTAMKFYEKHGYSQSGRVSDFFGMPLVEYRKDLPLHPN
jgi:GNAT superfamily N-acetyltransferase